MSTSEFWTNNDGLNVRFWTEKGAAVKSGHLSTMGDEKQAVFTITGTDLGSSDALLDTHPLVGIPDGSHIISATIYVTTAFTSGGSATLTIGLWNDDGDGTFSVNDADGIDATIALSAINAIGETISCDGALVGNNAIALAGTSDRPLYVSAYYATAAFTAGVLDLVIRYR